MNRSLEYAPFGPFDDLAVFAIRGLRCPRGHPVVVEVVATTVQHGPGTLETAPKRILIRGHAQVPLAGHVGVIARVLQQPGDRDDLVIQVALVSRHTVLVRQVVFGHRAQAVEMIVDAGHQQGAGRRAGHLGVEAGETRTFRSQGVQIRRLDLAAECAEVTVPQIVGDDQKDVGAAALSGVAGGLISLVRAV